VWSNLLRFLQFPVARKLLLLEALYFLAVARLAMFLLPFRRVATWLGTVGAETPQTAAEEFIRQAREIAWAIAVLARRVPWDSRCLAQALAGTAMLRRRSLEGTVSFGAGRDGESKFSAHAWLRFGPLMVTGGPGHDRFQLFTTFARREK
jgi:hypothetical protein